MCVHVCLYIFLLCVCDTLTERLSCRLHTHDLLSKGRYAKVTLVCMRVCVFGCVCTCTVVCISVTRVIKYKFIYGLIYAVDIKHDYSFTFFNIDVLGKYMDGFKLLNLREA